MPIPVRIHVVRAFPREEEILLQALSFTQAGQSVLTVKLQIVRITAIISVMQTMLISGAVAQRIVRKRNVQHSGKHNPNS